MMSIMSDAAPLAALVVCKHAIKRVVNTLSLYSERWLATKQDQFKRPRP